MFKLNGKEYKDIELTFNAVCDLEKRGFDLAKIADGQNVLSFARAVIAIAFDDDLEVAGTEIGNHLKSGGKIEDITEILNKAIKSSGFF